MNYLESISDVLTDYKIQHNLNITQLAEKLNTTDRSVSNWLKGKSCPYLENLICIANLSNYSLDYVVGRSIHQAYTPSIQNQSFLERLDSLLSSKHESYTHLAKTCEFSEAIFAKWRKGKVPKLDVLLSIANHFDVTLDYLVGRSDSI